MNKPISIHAPTRGATINSGEWRLYGKISIHAPTRGATSIAGRRNQIRINFNPRSHKGSDPMRILAWIRYRYFNPRSHKGSDGNPEARCAWCIGISIHAPTRGATVEPEKKSGWIQISIHAPTRGATGQCDFIAERKIFQSTLPQGERRLIAED